MLAPSLTAQQAVVQYGPCELEGYMLPTGEFRQSLRSTARAIDMKWGSNLGVLMRQLATESGRPGQTLAASRDLGEKEQNGAQGIVTVNTGFSGASAMSQAQTLDLTTANAFWAHCAIHATRDDVRQNAVNLLAAGSRITLEQAYCEAFGVAKDGRSISDQVLESWLDLTNMTRRRLSNPDFLYHSKRVTGWDLLGKNPYAAIVWDELVWHRLPENIYKQMDELNPVVSPIITKPCGKQVGWRRYAKAQLLSDPAFDRAAAPIITAATMCLQMSPSRNRNHQKVGNLAYRGALKQLDTLFPRFIHRGKKSQPVIDVNQSQLVLEEAR